jgi:hypothetical protein
MTDRGNNSLTPSRRAVVGAVCGTGLAMALGSGAAIAQSGDINGKVTDVHGNEVSGATVTVYDASQDADATVASTMTNSSGDYTISTIETNSGETPSEILMTFEDGDWFSIQYINNITDRLPLEYNTTLDHEKLFGPKYTDPKISMLTCWRDIYTPTEQILNFEIANINRSAEPYEVAVDGGDLTSGTFSTTVLADDIWMNFGSQSDLEMSIPINISALPTGYYAAADWHPLRTNLPTSEYGSVGAPYRELSTTEAKLAERVDEGFYKILSVLPGISSVLSWMDALEYAFGGLIGTEASLGNFDTGYINPNDKKSTQPIRNPNKHTTASLAWESNNTDFEENECIVKHRLPLEFQYDSERTSLISSEVEWNHKISHAAFGQLFEIGPIGDENHLTNGGN